MLQKNLSGTRLADTLCAKYVVSDFSPGSLSPEYFERVDGD